MLSGEVTVPALANRRVDRCIYCGSTDQLSDEHALPDGLRGSIIVKNGSCEKCRKIIQPMEDHVLSIQLGPLRHAWGLVRKPNAKTRLNLPVHGSNRKRYKAKVPVEDLPRYSFAIPRYSTLPHVILLDAERSDEVFLAAQVGKRDLELQLRKYGGTFTQEFHSGYFPRILAKMGHAVLAAHLGIDGWEPTLARAIREGTPADHWNRAYLGTPAHLSKVTARHEPGDCPVQAEVGLVNGADGTTYWAVNLHLLPQFSGTPSHGIIVGKAA